MSNAEPVRDRMKTSTHVKQRGEDCKDCSGSIQITDADFEEVKEIPDPEDQLDALVDLAKQGASEACAGCEIRATSVTWNAKTKKGRIVVKGADPNSHSPGSRGGINER